MDGPGRRVLKAMALARFRFDLAVHRGWRRLRGRAPWILAGACGGCAACCQAPSIQVGAVTWHLPLARRLFLAWQREVNGFHLVDRVRSRRVFVFRCSHFEPSTGRCDSYATRPGMCRDYPRVLLEQPNPEFLPGCGYRAVLRAAPRLQQALDRAGVSGPRRDRLEEDLRLRP